MCIFCMIANHEINSSIIYEDEHVVACFDLSQVTKGHTLVVPKKHYENVLECDPETLGHVIKVTQMLSKRIMERMNAKGVNILNNLFKCLGVLVLYLKEERGGHDAVADHDACGRDADTVHAGHLGCPRLHGLHNACIVIGGIVLKLGEPNYFLGINCFTLNNCAYLTVASARIKTDTATIQMSSHRICCLVFLRSILRFFYIENLERLLIYP